MDESFYVTKILFDLMKFLAIFSIFILFAIASGVVTTSAFAQTVSAPVGSAVPGCEETDECFIPSEITVDIGATVTWSNDDNAAHTVTSGSAADGPDGKNNKKFKETSL